MDRLEVDSSWTLFLDRDGVINKLKEQSYIFKWSEFEFLPEVLNFFKKFSNQFLKVIVVTNQQGIGKGLMLRSELEIIHLKMKNSILEVGGKLDAIYYCPNLKEDNALCRKPNIGMGLQAKKEYPEIDFSKSIMVGDNYTDMLFGMKLGMNCFWINKNKKSTKNITVIESLNDLANCIKMVEI